MTTTSLILDIWQKNHVIVKANQGEVNSRFLEITLTDKSVPLDLTSKTVFFYATKPDGNVIFNSCEIENAKNGTVTVCLTSQMFAKPGIKPCEVHIIDNEKSILKAVGLELEIVKCANLKDAVESKSEFTALEEAMAEYESASEKFNFHLDSRNNPHEVTTAQIGAVPATRTINSKILNSDIELTPEDVGAAAAEHTHAASEITSGVLPIERGGTGAATKSEAQKSLQIYTDVTQLGLAYPCTMADILDALPTGSIANFGFNMKSDGITDAPISFDQISIFYPSQARRLVFCTQCIASGGEFSNFYLGYYISSERTMNWYKIPNGSMVTSIANGGTGATTASAALENLGAVPQTRTINSKALNSDIELNCDDIGAAAEDHKHGAGDITSGGPSTRTWRNRGCYKIRRTEIFANLHRRSTAGAGVSLHNRGHRKCHASGVNRLFYCGNLLIHCHRRCNWIFISRNI